MSEINDGGHAFPNITPDMRVDGGPGMSLRDWFAGQALAGLIASGRDKIALEADRYTTTDTPVQIAAYVIADAMIAARGGAK